MRIEGVFFGLLALLVLSASTNALARPADCGAPPSSPSDRSLQVTKWGQRKDPYAWLINKRDPRRDAYLKQENQYALCRLKPLAPLITTVDKELRSRLDHKSSHAPFIEEGYVYRINYGKGANQRVILRRKVGEPAGWQVVLDISALSSGRRQYTVDNWVVSPDGKRVAFAVDTTGGRRDHLFMRNIGTGAITDLGVERAGRYLAFASDHILFYNTVDRKTVRSDGIWRHRLGSPANQDVRVFWDPNPHSEVSVYSSASHKFIFFKSRRETSSETWYLPADHPTRLPLPVAPRRKNVKYDVDQAGTRFFIRTNLGAPDYRLMTAPIDHPGNWKALVPEKPGHYLRKFVAFDTFAAFEREHDATMSVHVVRFTDRREVTPPLPRSTGVARLGVNRNPSSTFVRFTYSSPIDPRRTYDFDPKIGDLTLRRVAPSAHGFDPALYNVSELHASADDGARVPVTLVYRKSLLRPGGNPTLLYGYGAYGDSLLAKYRPDVFSLINRGFIFAIAHVRGGREKGEAWYVAGRGLNKKNSFSDFISVGKFLDQSGFTNPHQLFAYGASAGGLLVGAAVNIDPSLFAGVIADVPFVDVVTTATDPLAPLSTLEYREWGDPWIRQQYNYMLSYSPYDNVKRQAYPPLFVTGATNDTQVDVREPAKWVAKLRALKTDQNELIFRVRFGSGHDGPSGRLGGLSQEAEMYAWLLNLAGEQPAREARQPSSLVRTAGAEE